MLPSTGLGVHSIVRVLDQTHLLTLHEHQPSHDGLGPIKRHTVNPPCGSSRHADNREEMDSRTRISGVKRIGLVTMGIKQCNDRRGNSLMVS
jgi:hypothetical protein